MLTIESACVRYGGIVALRDVSVEVKQGETVLLVGSNGAGKSSLINAVMGLVPLLSGRIRFDGQDLARVSCAARARL
ncbi:MAG: ATP-binding cassette domain-containing protein, partial [Verrucomicrobiota bacterium]